VLDLYRVPKEDDADAKRPVTGIGHMFPGGDVYERPAILQVANHYPKIQSFILERRLL
jgi:hypothetical protein